MSPEQAAGNTDEISPQSDIYSLGAILYRALTGQAPFAQSHPLHMLIGSIEGDPPVPRTLNPNAPRDLQAICLRCLEKNPKDRYPSAAALAEDLERYVAGEQVDARSTGWLQKLRRWARRETALASRWVAIGTAATIVQVKYWISGSDAAFHSRVMAIFAIWAVAAFVFQKLLFRKNIAGIVRFAWSAADAIFLTLVLSVTGPPVGPLVIGYPLLIAASGLFFRVRLVWFTTFVAIVSYSVLVFTGVELHDPPHYALIFAAALAVVGFIMAYQVERVRILSRYYDQRRGM
jgi:serine/threonine-protein kinase